MTPTNGGACPPAYDWCAAEPEDCALEDGEPVFGEEESMALAGAAAGPLALTFNGPTLLRSGTTGSLVLGTLGQFENQCPATRLQAN